MFRDASGFKRVIICCGIVDMRKGIDGLATYVRFNYHLEPKDEGTLFLFCGRRKDRIKGLLYEGDGFLLLYKRLNHGSRFRWPKTADEAREITKEQFRMLMDGFAIESTIMRHDIRRKIG